MWLQQLEKYYTCKFPANGTFSERFYFYRENLKKCTVLTKHNHTYFFVPKTYRIDEILTNIRNQYFNA